MSNSNESLCCLLCYTATLLQDMSVKAVGKREKLLRVIKNPVTKYLPVNSRKIGLSYSSDKLVKMRDYVAGSSDDTDLVFVVYKYLLVLFFRCKYLLVFLYSNQFAFQIGAMSHGKIEADYIDDFVAGIFFN